MADIALNSLVLQRLGSGGFALARFQLESGDEVVDAVVHVRVLAETTIVDVQKAAIDRAILLLTQLRGEPRPAEE